MEKHGRISQPRVLAMILAGGKGTRLMPLTEARSKPAVPFGGAYRIIDFVLSNFYNSGILGMHVMVQYRSQSLIEHLRKAWRIGDGERQFVTVVPPQMNSGAGWYEGTADAVFQNLNLIRDFAPDIVAVFGADHIYRMDIRQMVQFHLDREADVSVATLPVPVHAAQGFGIVEIDRTSRVVGFDEKPPVPKSMPGDPAHALSSMGNYLFNADVLIQALEEDAKQKGGSHDFGRDILPRRLKTDRVMAYNFLDNEVPGVGYHEEPAYWRDVGTIQAYWQANMDLLGDTPPCDLGNREWPIRTEPSYGPPASLVNCYVDHALIGEGTRAIEADIRRSIIGRHVRIESGAYIEDSIIFDHTHIGAGAKLQRVVVDRHNTIPANVDLGPRGQERGEEMDAPSEWAESGVLVIPKPQAATEEQKRRLPSY
ncbi:MAG TPA: glucose-1-phosphate adenylyltransferase [Nitrospira sp.]|nr:glucose-1-phosphate adenylyltransferase [Nitrospira sp.]HNA46074.1 glucose-1-phosphate adenylyltransferase [Nitrospira sp.]HNC83356.1 glucose-1-phosphate adenylyltransferase [Nitrospira sp.]HND00446.1 glucose-1-phosphate adenylyltransferase [Nitrospira sp.]HNE31278.1 glucose-1-phosphate adenylyltransferase [Nitrospira sp.]